MRQLRLAPSARSDIVELLARTQRTFGVPARRRYRSLVTMALDAIHLDPARAGCLHRPELGPGVWSYHLRHSRDVAAQMHGLVRRPRHLLLYQCPTPELIEIVRVLHDAMELSRHLPASFEPD